MIYELNSGNAINVLYEDNHVLVVEKPAGILSQSNGDESILDMVSLSKEYLKYKYNKPGNVYAGLLSRLDRNVSGLIVIAKTDKSAKRLNDERPIKTYRALVYGKIEKDEGTLVDYILKDEKRKVAYKDDNGKIAILRYKAIDKNDKYSLLDVKIETGRFHQIRFQLSNIGHPIYNDVKYNKNLDINCDDTMKIYLDAYKVEFTHPTLKEKIVVERDSTVKMIKE